MIEELAEIANAKNDVEYAPLMGDIRAAAANGEYELMFFAQSEEEQKRVVAYMTYKGLNTCTRDKGYDEQYNIEISW